MATVNLNNQMETIVTGSDNIVIIDNFQSIRGGRSLDVTGFVPREIKAGHIIIKSDEGEYKPMPVGSDNSITELGTITGGSSYVDKTYDDVPLTGGEGSGAKATIEVKSGAVTKVTLTDAGTGYEVGDELSAANTNLGNAGSGFKVPVGAVSDEISVYGTLPKSHSYAGILIASIPTSKPFASIMTRGTVNVNASPYQLDSILNAVKLALPLVVFTHDKA